MLKPNAMEAMSVFDFFDLILEMGNGLSFEHRQRLAKLLADNVVIYNHTALTNKAITDFYDEAGQEAEEAINEDYTSTPELNEIEAEEQAYQNEKLRNSLGI